MRHKVIALRDRVAILFPGTKSELPFDNYITQIHDLFSTSPNDCSVFYCGDDTLPDIDDYNHYRITGSPHSVHEETPWLSDLKNFLSSVIHSGNYDSIFAVCFGHQLIATLMGGTVSETPEWSVEIKPYDLDGDTVPLFACHSQKVTTQPLHSSVFLTHATDTHAGLIYPMHRMLTVQPHPEASRARINTLIGREYDFYARRYLPVSSAVMRVLNHNQADISRSSDSIKHTPKPGPILQRYGSLLETSPPRRREKHTASPFRITDRQS